jgi:MATE family multidrug resistance protein
MLLLLLLLIARADLEPLLSRIDPLVLRLRPLVELTRLGAPVGVQMQLEIFAFAVIALLMGAMGTVPIAAHQVAISLASLTFMVPVGVAQAAAVRVGHAVGRRDDDGARRAASAALVWGGGFMTAATALFLAVPRPLAAAYTSSPEVLALAAALIPIAGFFQIFDGFQAVSAGILRGVGDTRVPMLVAVLGFWVVGMPVSLYLGYPAGFGPVGLWWGFVAGLGAVALFLLGRVGRLLSRPLERVAVE